MLLQVTKLINEATAEAGFSASWLQRNAKNFPRVIERCECWYWCNVNRRWILCILHVLLQAYLEAIAMPYVHTHAKLYAYMTKTRIIKVCLVVIHVSWNTTLLTKDG